MLIITTHHHHYHHHHHPRPPRLAVPLSLLLHMLSLSTMSTAYTFIYAGCSQEKYQPSSSSSYEANLNSLLTSFVSSSTLSLYNHFSIGGSGDDSAVYGVYQCRGDLKPSDCSNCIRSDVSQIGLVCPYSTGATLQLDACYVRYEKFDFIGKQDTTVMYKRCSKSSSTDVDFLRKRDDVLSDVEGAVGFRVSSSGSVQGFGQCLGDLGQPDCSACLAEAVKELKTLCGSAAAAQVFLGKCYAQYWAAGYYDFSTQTSDPTHEDDVAKTIAIIVGIIGGIAVLIVLLSLCRKSSAPAGK